MLSPERKISERPKKRRASKTKVIKKTVPQKEKYYFSNELLTLCFASLSIFVFFILLLSNRSDLVGVWGMTLGSSLKDFFGLPGFLIVFILGGLAFISWKKAWSFKFIAGGFIFFLNIILLTELLFDKGGTLGHAGLTFISAYLGVYGSGLILFTVLLMTFIILTGISLGRIFSFCKMFYYLSLFLYKKIISLMDWIFYVSEDESEEDEPVDEEKKEICVKKKKEKKVIPEDIQEVSENKNDVKTVETIPDEKVQEDLNTQVVEISPPEEEPFSFCEEPQEGIIIDEIEFPEKPSVKIIEETFSQREVIDTEEEKVETEEMIEPEETFEPAVMYNINSLNPFLLEPEKELELPPLSLLLDLEPPPKPDVPEDRSIIASLLEDTLASFGVTAKVVHQEIGPSITRYELQPAKGVRVNKITSLSDDIALALAALSVRLEAPIPGKSAIGIEIPNKKPKPVYFGEILSSPAFQNSPSKLTIGLGKDITGNPIVGDLAKMPHLLIAGATGAGKSVCLNSIVASILFKARPNEVHFAMIDPKRVELSVYKTIPHLVSINREHRVVVNPAEASELLDSVVKEMDDRYRLLAENRVRNIAEFNVLDPAKIKFPSNMEEEHTNLVGIENKFPMPYIVVIIDELADLMMVAPGEVEKSICRLAQLARAVGIHLVVATQRPSVNVITGIIKANIPSRISFAVSSQIDSRTILDMAGAEKLIGKGDMLYLPAGALKPQRVQGAFVSLEAIEKLVSFWETQSPPENLTDFKVDLEKKKENTQDLELEDELLSDAVDIVLASRSASVSQLQRALRVGHARAGRLIDIMEKIGVVGPWEGSKPRKILVNDNPFNGPKEEEL
ncbi:MAG TPA: DNA translocase FtsK [Candidatus Eremiobacteraeota bacterium]|nr:MAG: DNA translocase SpoIIIE [bacterium ADurb.Bin363]HPZ10024.1 DNA translocase FtsK [Candidatus Eremiobacteraeota bacterium]